MVVGFADDYSIGMCEKRGRAYVYTYYVHTWHLYYTCAHILHIEDTQIGTHFGAIYRHPCIL